MNHNAYVNSHDQGDNLDRNLKEFYTWSPTVVKFLFLLLAIASPFDFFVLLGALLLEPPALFEILLGRRVIRIVPFMFAYAIEKGNNKISIFK